jgi:hypothetical protein
VELLLRRRAALRVTLVLTHEAKENNVLGIPAPGFDLNLLWRTNKCAKVAQHGPKNGKKNSACTRAGLSTAS